MMQVPFVDLGAQYLAHKAEFDQAVQEVIESNSFVGGAFVEKFSRDFAGKYGVDHCVPCANGTDAIYIALRMLGIGAGDEVITTASSWIATSETITQAGAQPVFVDVDDCHLIDIDLIERAITERTRAIIPVHLYGQAVAMDRICEIAARHGLFVIEDCAQAHFAEWKNQRVGTFGNVAAFSFYPGKNLGAWGDAGAIITNDDGLALRCRMFANHGALKKHEHEMEGINSRLDGLQAAVLSVKLRYIDEWTSARQRVAAFYDEALNGIGDIIVPRVQLGARHVYHLYVVQTQSRDELKAHLEQRGVGVGIHYPTALPFLGAYRKLGFTANAFPRAASQQDRILSLPIYPEIEKKQTDYVVDLVRDFFGQR